MEFLKETLGEELYTQFVEKMKDSKIKLADLSGGAYVGADKFKSLEAERDGLKTQLGEAGKQIEAFKGMDIDGIKKAADDYKAAAKKAQDDADAKIAAMQFDYALERELTSAKVRDPKVVTPLLNRDALKYTDGTIAGLKEQLEGLAKSHGYLFEAPADEKPPQPAQQLPVGVSIFKPNTPPTAPSPQNLGEALKQKYRKD
ncbi:MAG: phage scaffolding protein [Sporomusa sp.]